MKAHQVLRKLQRAGFVEVHRKGSHRVLKNYDTGRIVVVPVHRGRDIPRGTLHNIIVRQAGLTIEEFNAL
jgi:predicted RNA binding protein YcfA (HicA-like mRNA interferase family)